MPLIPLKSQSQSHVLPDPASDYRAAHRVCQYRIGREAIYFPAFPGDRYLPYSAVDKVLSRPASMPLKGCCGKALPMVRLRMYYDDGAFYQDFMFEKLKQADEALDALLAARPEVHVMERATSFANVII